MTREGVASTDKPHPLMREVGANTDRPHPLMREHWTSSDRHYLHPNQSRVPAPESGREMSANIGLISNSLKTVIYRLLETRSEMTGSELEKLFQEKTGKNPPPSFLAIVDSLPDVVCRR